MQKKTVAIIGAGFAGAYLAQKLKKEKDLEIFLIDKQDHFLFTPLLVEVASASLSVPSVVEFLPQVLRNKNVKFIKEEVLNIDLSRSVLKLENRALKYDYLAIATGSKTNYQITGSREYSLVLKEAKDATLIKEKIINHLFQHEHLNLAVVGSGLTGIELISDLTKLISEFNKYLKVKKTSKLTLIGSRANILGDWSKDLQKKALAKLISLKINLKLGTKVKEIKEKEIILENNEVIKADLTILSSGVLANVLETLKNQLVLNRRGDILVNDYLQIENFKNVFAFGDVANNENGSWEKLAQTASKQAQTVSLNINNLKLNKSLVVYKHKLSGKLLALGKFYAVGEIFGIKFYGFLAWFVWRTVYLFKFLSYRKKIQVAVQWTVNLFSPRDLSTWRK